MKKVKRAESFMIADPYRMQPHATVRQIRDFMAHKGVGSILVHDAENKLLGVVTERDLRFVENETTTLDQVMTRRESLIVARRGVSLEEAKHIIAANKYALVL